MAEPQPQSKGNMNGKNEYYNMNHKYRGEALIFSHEIFDIDKSPRPGTTVDYQNLDTTLQSLGFSVKVYPNLRYEHIMKHINKTAALDHSKYDCLLIAVLTHGESGLLYARDTHYRTEKLWCPFTDENCPSLAGKPRIFILQACQGDQFDEGITMSRNIETDGWFEPDKIPNHPDFLLALSTVPGYFAWRHTVRGSWFIQALCEELRNRAFDTDILTLLTFVSQKVALDFESNNPDDLEYHEKKQVPCISSTLTRLLLFTEKPNDSHQENKLVRRFNECIL